MNGIAQKYNEGKSFISTFIFLIRNSTKNQRNNRSKLNLNMTQPINSPQKSFNDGASSYGHSVLSARSNHTY